MDKSIKVAVCMPAFNAQHMIKSAIQSILKQSYRNFIFIITDDCSTDDTIDVIKSFDDERILLMENKVNLGPAETRNGMLKYCIANKYKYMALMDADDIAYPDRLQKQIEILEMDSSLAVCGSSMLVQKKNTTWVAPMDPCQIKAECIFGNPIPTPTATIRLRFIEQYNLMWDKSFVPCADYHFWYLMLFKHNLRARNTGDIDMVYTYSKNGVSNSKGLIKQEEKDAYVKQLILKEVGINAPYDDIFKFMKIALHRSDNPDDAIGYINIARAIKDQNKKKSIVSQFELEKRINSRTTNYLRKVNRLDEYLKKTLIDELMLNQIIFLIRIEKALKKLKHLLDRPFPYFSFKLSQLYLYIKHKIT
jgi:glycosyltransferase involved in cell wall biosynthesis